MSQVTETPNWAAWLDSMEGVPEWPQPAESPVEKAARGSIPLSTLQAHIDYGFAQALTAQGMIGVKVWINLGTYAEEEATDGTNAKAGQIPQKPKKAHKR